MKVKNLFLFVALATVALVGCGKDDNDDTTTATVAGQNELVMDGVKYGMHSHAQIDSQQGRIYLDAELISDPETRILRADVEASSYNATFDLTTFAQGEYAFAIEYPVFIQQDNHADAGVYGMLDDANYEQAVFASGTLTILKNDDGVSYKIEGKTKNNHTVSLNAFVPDSEIEEVPWNLEK